MKKLSLIATLMAGGVSLMAAEAGFQASLTPDLAVQPTTTRIQGVALSIWGENPQDALALGFVNGSTGPSEGLSWGLVNYADDYTGVAWAAANISWQRFYGWENGVVNFSQGSGTGLQTGVVNITEDFHGLQAGCVNYSENLRGLQIGVINIAMNNTWFEEFPNELATGFPFVNWSF
jgi:hypothetical protein